jgi:hypothetical protein
MKSSIAVSELEISLIELEYAAADFSQRKVSEPLELWGFDALLSKLMAANRAVQIAVNALGKGESRHATSIGNAKAACNTAFDAFPRRAVKPWP